MGKEKLLPCILTVDETVEFARLLATTQEALRKHQDATASARKISSEREKNFESEIDRLAGIIRDGKKHRYVEVETRADWEKNTMKIVRLDTGEIVSERAMTQEERQMSLAPQEEVSDSTGRKVVNIGR